MEQIVFICTGNTCRSPMAEISRAMNGQVPAPDFRHSLQSLLIGTSVEMPFLQRRNMELI